MHSNVIMVVVVVVVVPINSTVANPAQTWEQMIQSMRNPLWRNYTVQRGQIGRIEVVKRAIRLLYIVKPVLWPL